MHCDTMRVFTSRYASADNCVAPTGVHVQSESYIPNARLAEGDRDRIRGGSFFGLSLLIAAAVMSHGYACGCIKAEMLAINDDGMYSGQL